MINNYNETMVEAATEGYEDTVRLLLDRGPDNYNEAMVDAADGHENIARLMLNRNADDFNWATTYAAEGGHENIVRL